MAKLDVFDPAMCCSTGVCGPAVDPVLPRFAADLDWLRRKGIRVERFNLSQQPGAFAANRIVKAALDEDGTACLPLIIVNGSVASRGTYPDRDSLMRMTEIDDKNNKGLYTDSVAELVAVGAAIAANCEPCFKFHTYKARKLGVLDEDIVRAVATGQAVREAAGKYLDAAAIRYTTPTASPRSLSVLAVQSCCGPESVPGEQEAASGGNGGSKCC